MFEPLVVEHAWWNLELCGGTSVLEHVEPLSSSLEFMCMHDGLTELCMIYDLWWECCGWWLGWYICVLYFLWAVMKDQCVVTEYGCHAHHEWEDNLWRHTVVSKCIQLPYKTRQNLGVTKSTYLYMTFLCRQKNLSETVLARTIYDISYIRWRIDWPMCDSYSRHKI